MRAYDDVPDMGLLYDHVPLYEARRDIAFYVGEAAGITGTILELGCGTGRILLPLARAGHTVVGLDGSRQMLDRCEANVRAEPPSVRDRITLRHADARDVWLDGTFDLVIAPFRVMQHLVTIDDQLRFLGVVTRHLAPAGRFVFDVFNPDFARLVGADGTEREDTPAHKLPDGRSFRRTARVTGVRWTEQISEVELIYYLSGAPGAPEERHVQAFDMRWYLHAELLHLLARAGLRPEAVYGDFDRSPLEDGSREQIVRTRLAGSD